MIARCTMSRHRAGSTRSLPQPAATNVHRRLAAEPEGSLRWSVAPDVNWHREDESITPREQALRDLLNVELLLRTTGASALTASESMLSGSSIASSRAVCAACTA